MGIFDKRKPHEQKPIKQGSWEKQLKKEIETLDREQLVQFAWLAVARCLPLTSHARVFNNSDESVTQKYLFSQFVALDCCMGIAPLRDACAGVSSTAVNSVRDRAHEVANRIFALASARDLALALDLDLDLARDLALALARALDLARALARALRSLMLDDIKCIRNQQWHGLNNDTKIYGSLWEKFQKDLHGAGCAYWAKTYAELFARRFQSDMAQLERRLNQPMEFIEEMNAARFAARLEKLETDARRLNEARIILLGEKGAGKTSLARRLIDPEAKMPELEESTMGVDMTTGTLRGISQSPKITPENDAKIHIWDFAGHTVTHAAHRFFLSERCVYVVVHDGRTDSCSRVNYWLDQIHNYGGRSKVFLLVNIKDKNAPEVLENQWKQRYPEQQVEIHEFSIAADGAKLAKFSDVLAGYIVDNPSWSKAKISREQYAVKEAIEKYFISHDQKDYISKDEIDEIIDRLAPGADGKEILKDLTLLGTCLWYPEIDYLKTVVLNPRWITEGIYTIINHLKNSKAYSVLLRDLGTIFKDNRNYPAEKHEFLYRLLLRYALAYEKTGRNELIVPQCMNADSPPQEKLPRFDPSMSLLDEVKGEYEVKGEDGDSVKTRMLTFPPDVLPRFIVRRHLEAQVDQELVWLSGAVFKNGTGATALLRREDDYSLKLWVTGTTRAAYQKELLDDLISILNEYENFRTNKPVISFCLINEDGRMTKHRLSYSGLVGLKKRRKKTYTEPSSGEKFSVQINYNTYISGDKNVDNSRKIDVNGGSTYVGTNNGTITVNKITLPESISSQQMQEFAKFIEHFLNSDAAKGLSKEESAKFNEAAAMSRKGKWNKARGIFADVANFTTIGTALGKFVLDHGNTIAKWITECFQWAKGLV